MKSRENINESIKDLTHLMSNLSELHAYRGIAIHGNRKNIVNKADMKIENVKNEIEKGLRMLILKVETNLLKDMTESMSKNTS